MKSFLILFLFNFFVTVFSVQSYHELPKDDESFVENKIEEFRQNSIKGISLNTHYNELWKYVNKAVKKDKHLTKETSIIKKNLDSIARVLSRDSKAKIDNQVKQIQDSVKVYHVNSDSIKDIINNGIQWIDIRVNQNLVKDGNVLTRLTKIQKHLENALENLKNCKDAVDEVASYTEGLSTTETINLEELKSKNTNLKKTINKNSFLTPTNNALKRINYLYRQQNGIKLVSLLGCISSGVDVQDP